jgi:jumonji domain-containing protein 7
LRNADAIVDGHFVEPHQRNMPFSEMLDWLLSRRKAKDGCVRYVQSQNGNLCGEFEPLRHDVSELDWATECLGTARAMLTPGENPDASNIWIGNEESTTSVHLGMKHFSCS